MRSEISKQSTCRDWGWATGLPHSYLLLSEGETGFASWTRTHSAPLLCQTPAPSTVLLSLHLATIGFEKPSSFYKHNCSSQVLSSQLSPGTEHWQKTSENGVRETSADADSWQGLPTPAWGWNCPPWMLTVLCPPCWPNFDTIRNTLRGIQLTHWPKHHYQLSMLLICELTDTLC